MKKNEPTELLALPESYIFQSFAVFICGFFYLGFLEESRLMNRPLLSQCYYIIDQAKEKGISQTELGIKLGSNKLLARLMLRSLLKMNVVIMVSSEDARKRFYRSVVFQKWYICYYGVKFRRKSL